MTTEQIASLVNKGYTVEFSPGDDGLDEENEPFTFHAQLSVGGRYYHGEYTHDLEAVLDDWQSFEHAPGPTGGDLALDDPDTGEAESPACPYCDHAMNELCSHYEQDGGHTVAWACPRCEAEEQHTRYPPARERCDDCGEWLPEVEPACCGRYCWECLQVHLATCETCRQDREV